MGKNDLSGPVWSEGMFLTPHHMQYFGRSQDARLWAMTSHLAAFGWGYKALQIAEDALGDYQFKLAACQAVFPGGLLLSWPGNADVVSRSFKELMPAQGGLMVYLGVPELHPDQANLQSAGQADHGLSNPRYIPAEKEELDSNTGEMPRKIVVQRLRTRLFFGSEDRAGYETLPLARLVPAPGGAGARLDAHYIPPVLSLGSWTTLLALAQEISSRTAATLGALKQNMAGREFSELISTPRGHENSLKFMALAGPAEVLGQMSRVPSTPALDFYLQMAGLCSTLSLFQGAGETQAPAPYQHDNPGPCFFGLLSILGKLLERLASPSFMRRSFVLRQDRLQVELAPDWVSGRRHLYLGVSGTDDPEIMAKKAAGLKLCAPKDLDEVQHRRLGAIPIEWLRKAPNPLPARSNMLYGRISAGGPFWAGVQEDLALDILGHESLSYRFDLFAV